MEEKKPKKEYVYNVVVMESHRLLQIQAFHKRMVATTYMVATSYYAQQQREKEGFADCELKIESDNNIVVKWNNGSNTMTFDIIRTQVK